MHKPDSEIGVEIPLATVSHSLSVDRYLCEVDIVVVKGKDLVVEVSTRLRSTLPVSDLGER